MIPGAGCNVACDYVQVDGAHAGRFLANPQEEINGYTSKFGLISVKHLPDANILLNFFHFSLDSYPTEYIIFAGE